MESPYKKKIHSLIIWIVILFFIIFSRLAYLQIAQNENFFNLGVKNFLRTEPIACTRGNILDTNGMLLRQIDQLQIYIGKDPVIGNLTQSPTKPYSTTPRNFIEFRLMQKILFVQKKLGIQAIIATDISFAQLSKIVELFANNPKYSS